MFSFAAFCLDSGFSCVKRYGVSHCFDEGTGCTWSLKAVIHGATQCSGMLLMCKARSGRLLVCQEFMQCCCVDISLPQQILVLPVSISKCQGSHWSHRGSIQHHRNAACRDIADAYLRPPHSQIHLNSHADSHSALHWTQPVQPGAQPTISSPMHSWQQLLDDQHACVTVGAVLNPHKSMHGMIPPSVRQHIEPRVVGGLKRRVVRNQLDAAQALSELGFSVFHGGVCSSVIESHGGYGLHQC